MKKRLFLIISMLAVAFTLAGCSSNDKKVAFDYDNDTIAAYANTLANGYIKLSEDEAVVENWEANGTDAVYISGQGQQVSISQSDVDAVKVFSSMEKDYGKFESLDSKYEIEEVKDTVIVTLTAKCEKETAEVKVTFVDDTARFNYLCEFYQMDADSLIAQGVYPYKPSEFETGKVQTLGEKMKDAGTNTIIGMGIVFVVLIFISFVISLLKYVPMLLDKETREKRKAEKAKAAAGAAGTDEAAEEQKPSNAVVDIVNTETGASVMDDSQLVAVISAAVAAYESGNNSQVTYPSNDKLVVRPRKKNKR